MNNPSLVDILAEESLVFHYVSGDVTPIELPNSTGWRTIDGIVVSQVVNGILNVQVDGGNVQVSKKDGGFIMCPEVFHIARPVCGKEIICRWSVVNYSLFGVVDLTSLLNVPVIVDPVTARELGNINEELSCICAKPSSIGSYVRKMELGFKMLSIIIRISPLKENAIVFLKQIQRLFPVLKYIDSNLNSQLSRKDLARITCLSLSHFNMIFRQVMGMSPMEFLKKRRLKKAQLLLSSSDFTVNEIAERVGYKDQFHFSRDFKKECHVSPMHFRKMITELF